jgi:choline dehydrogenase-like flavoprotein
MRDVIVVGAGGGGAVVAKELAARGLDVLVLEAGAAARPEKDWTHYEIDQSAPASGVLRFGPSDRTRSPWSRELAQNGLVWQVAGVGGTTQHYYANSPRAYPGVFRGYAGADAAAYDRAHEFPFSYRDLIPYYEWVEETLPVQTAPMGRKEQAFLDGAGRLGLAVQRSKDTSTDSYRPQENAILQPFGTAGTTADSTKLHFPQAVGCTFCGHCQQGCMEPLDSPRNLRAKRSTDNSYMPMALTADRWAHGGRAVALVPDAFATRIETETVGGKLVARGVSWRSTRTGETHTETARVVVSAAGAIETPRLWLLSELPNPNGWVGRGLTDHHLDLVVGLMPRDIGSSKGPGSGARADFPGRGSIEGAGGGPAVVALAAGLSDSGMAGLYDNGSPVGDAGADGVGRAVGPGLKTLLADVDRLLAILVVTDDDVEAQNRVSLSSTSHDEHGPIARIEIRHRQRSARTASNREFLARRAVELARAAGAVAVFRANWPPALVHIHSTMRMGTDASGSVLDESCEARAVPRLFVADNSALSNGLGGPNPTLTTQALATRTCERILQRYFEGDPWVKRERPVSSIDPRVTFAVVGRGL